MSRPFHFNRLLLYSFHTAPARCFKTIGSGSLTSPFWKVVARYTAILVDIIASQLAAYIALIMSNGVCMFCILCRQYLIVGNRSYRRCVREHIWGLPERMWGHADGVVLFFDQYTFPDFTIRFLSILIAFPQTGIIIPYNCTNFWVMELFAIIMIVKRAFRIFFRHILFLSVT